MLLTTGPIVWPTDPTAPPNGADPDLWPSAVAVAVDHLWANSGRQFGTRSTVYRPQALWLDRCYDDAVPYLQSLYGALTNGWPYASDPRNPGGVIARSVLQLPGPAVSVTAVQVVDADGTVHDLTPTEYRLDGNYLVRVGDVWPTTQNLLANAGEPDTWQVTYSRGTVPPPRGQVAAYELAKEVLKQLSGDATCKLPWNATTSSRGSVTVNREISQAIKATNVEIADRWVASVNPAGLAQPPTVWTPDLPRGGRPYAGSY